MKRSFLYFITIACLILMIALQQGMTKPVGIHSSNFFMLSYQDNIFYPIGVNADVLLKLDQPDETISKQIQQMSEYGINSIRLNIDHFTRNNTTVNDNKDGIVSDAVIKRLNFISKTAAQHQIVVFLSFFDLLDMAKNWETHPYQKSNGGNCVLIQDFFTHVQQRSHSIARIKQVISALKQYDNLVWDLGRGINIDEYNSMGNAEWRKQIMQWVIIMLDNIQRTDDHKHLIALSFLPNTLPIDMMGLAPVSLYLLHIQSHNNLLAVKSTTGMLKIVKEQRRPVFIGELTWTGESNQKSRFDQIMLWSMFASGSSAFLNSGSEMVSKEDLEHIKNLRFSMPVFNLTGRPRPPANPSPKTLPEGSYEMIEQISGFDWVFCLIRKSPGKNTVQMEIPTRTGWYDYQWFHIENGQILPNQRRKNTRNIMRMQSPEFEEIIIGRLRYLPDMEPNKPSTSDKAVQIE